MKLLVALGVWLVGCAVLGANAAEVSIVSQNNVIHKMVALVPKMVARIRGRSIMDEVDGESAFVFFSLIGKLTFDLVDHDQDEVISHEEFMKTMPRTFNDATKSGFGENSVPLPDTTFEFVFQLLAGKDQKLQWTSIANWFNKYTDLNTPEKNDAFGKETGQVLFEALDRDHDGRVNVDDMLILIPEKLLSTEVVADNDIQRPLKTVLTSKFENCKVAEYKNNELAPPEKKQSEEFITGTCFLDLINTLQKILFT